MKEKGCRCDKPEPKPEPKNCIGRIYDSTTYPYVSHPELYQVAGSPTMKVVNRAYPTIK